MGANANGIYLNIEDSMYIYKFKNLIFYFSSIIYKNKFENTLNEYIECEKYKNLNKYHIEILPDEFFALALYKKIEKRGFRVYINTKRIYENDKELFSINAT